MAAGLFAGRNRNRQAGWWLLQLIQNAGKEKPARQEMPAVIEEGSRNAAMASIAGSLRRKG